MHSGFSTAQGTAALPSRFPEQQAAGFYRRAQVWHVSSLGLGTYLGAPDEPTDRAYTDAVVAAVLGGINFLDTAINYRHQRSERSVGAALDRLFAGGFAREELVVCTKAGFLVPGALPAGLAPEDVAGGMHSMAPRFLADQIDRSRANLGLDTLDVFYLHNPETQLNFIPREEFEKRLALAFTLLESMAARAKIQYYGTATWHGYRRPQGAPDALSLDRMAEIAREAAGDDHHFRFVQLPFNLAMMEAFGQRNQLRDGQARSLLQAAAELGITVVASATLLQARLAQGLPAGLAQSLPGPFSDAQRAIQFTRSAPGVSVALVGMSDAAHVDENLAVARVPPASPQEFLRLFQPAS